VQEIVDDLAETAAGAADPKAEPAAASLRVLCIGARGAADVAAASMVAHLLRRVGVAAEVSDAGAMLRASGLIGGFDAVSVSYVDPEALRQARRLVNRLRTRLAGDTTICLGLYGLAPSEIESARAATHADIVVASLGQAVKKLTELGRAAEVVQAAASST
jgi:hypothetical protein